MLLTFPPTIQMTLCTCLYCEYGGSRSDVVEDSSLLGCDTVSLGRYLEMFRRYYLEAVQFILFRLLDPKDEVITVLRNVGNYSLRDEALHSENLNLRVVIELEVLVFCCSAGVVCS